MKDKHLPCNSDSQPPTFGSAAFRRVAFLVSLTLAGGAASALRAEETPKLSADKCASWGAETLVTIDRDYRVKLNSGESYYAEEYHPGKSSHPRPPAYMWSAGVHLSALAAAAAYDSQQYGPLLQARIESLEPY